MVEEGDVERAVGLSRIRLLDEGHDPRRKLDVLDRNTLDEVGKLVRDVCVHELVALLDPRLVDVVSSMAGEANALAHDEHLGARG